MKSKSLRQVARELNVSASYLSQVFHGKCRTTVKLLSSSSFKALSNVFNNSLERNTNGASGGIRTRDPRFTKALLCQLSYAGV